MDEYLQKGLFYSRREYRSYKRRKMITLLVLSVVLCSSILGAFKVQQSLSALMVAAELFPSYEKVVIQAMNGDARFAVGNELFECKGGYLGPAE